MNDNKRNIDELIKYILRKDPLDRLTEKAESGDLISQMLLGNIYFYGIMTAASYWQNLDRAIAWHNARQWALKHKPVSKCKPPLLFICCCHNEPDFDKALKWYKMAAQNGNSEAKAKIKQIENRNNQPIKRKTSYLQGLENYAHDKIIK